MPDKFTQTTPSRAGLRRTFLVEDLTNGDVQELARSIESLATVSKSMESAAQKAVGLLYDSLGGRDTVDRDAALVRIFKTHAYGKLPPDLQEFARRAALEISYSDDTSCLTLLGTAGAEASWNSRHLSGSHRAIAMPSVEVIERAPMIANLFRQLGYELNWIVQPSPELMLMEQKTFNVFFVPEAQGSEFIPAQASFVEPYGVRSVVGFGGILPNGELFVTILFLRKAISRETALRFSSLALSLRALLGPLQEQVFYTPEK